MGFFSDLFGGSGGKNAANAAADAQSTYTKKAYEGARTAYTAGADSADSILSGYEAPARRGYDLYADSVGVNGQEGYGRAFENFGQDPFNSGQDAAAQRAVQAQFRRYNPTGQTGTSQLAVARTAGDDYARRVGDYRNRLMGLGQQGAQFGQARAGLAVDRGKQLADYSIGENLGYGNIESQRFGNIYQAQSQGQGNVLKGLGAIAGLVAAPFTGGASLGLTAGSLASMGGGGKNAMMGSGYYGGGGGGGGEYRTNGSMGSGYEVHTPVGWGA